MSPRRRLALCLLVLLLPVPARAAPCSCCVMVNRPTFRQSAAGARIIVYGTLANARGEEDAGGPRSVDINIARVLKADPFLGNNKSLTLVDRYVPVNPKNPPRCLIFCDIYQGQLDPFLGVEVKSAALVDYVRGAVALDPKDPGAALRYFFRHLEHKDRDIADDALQEFGRADHRDLQAIAKDLPADRLADWLKQPKLAADRIHLYATLLGDCGTAAHARFLRQLLEKDGDQPSRDSLLVGYILLEPTPWIVPSAPTCFFAAHALRPQPRAWAAKKHDFRHAPPRYRLGAARSDRTFRATIRANNRRGSNAPP